MGSTLDFLGATLADALSPRFRRPVEDIIYETIDRKQIPTRTDFTELRNTINSLRSQSTGAQKGIEKLKKGLDDIEESIHELTTQVSDLETELKAVRAENQAMKASAPTTETAGQPQTFDPSIIEGLIARIEALESKPAAKTTSKTSASAEICKVPGCGSSVRAGGFCNSHYGKCRRGTLKDFVGFGGTAITSAGDKIIVGSEFGGMAYTEEDGNILVDGKVVATL